MERGRKVCPDVLVHPGQKTSLGEWEELGLKTHWSPDLPSTARLSLPGHPVPSLTVELLAGGMSLEDGLHACCAGCCMTCSGCSVELGPLAFGANNQAYYYF